MLLAGSASSNGSTTGIIFFFHFESLSLMFIVIEIPKFTNTSIEKVKMKHLLMIQTDIITQPV